jgi:hypothetical protein
MGWSTNRPTDYFAVGLQSAVNVEATTFQFPKHLNGTGFEQVPDIGEEREGGGGQEVALAYKKLIKADGNAVANVRGVGAVYALLDGVLGKTATIFGSAVTCPTGVQVVRMVSAPTLPYMTIEQRYSDQVERVTNAKVNQLTIEGGAGVPLKITAGFAGAGTVFQRDIGSAITPLYQGGDPIYYPRGSYVITGPTAAASAAASGAKITKYKVTAMRHLDEAVQTTELWRDDLIELQADYTADFTLKYEDRLLYQAINFGGGSVPPIPIPTLSVMLYSYNGQPTGATAYRGITVNMNNLLGKSAKVNKLEPDGKTVYVDLACTSIKPAGATDSLVIDLMVPSSAYAEAGQNFP